LLAIYLVYGSFSLIITEKTINPNVMNIADVLNLAGIIVAFLHFINIIINSGLSIKEDYREEEQCNFYTDSSGMTR